MSHVYVVSDQGQVANGHGLIDVACSIGSDKNRASHVGRKICWERLVSHSVALIVVYASIPYYGPAALHDRV